MIYQYKEKSDLKNLCSSGFNKKNIKYNAREDFLTLHFSPDPIRAIYVRIGETQLVIFWASHAWKNSKHNIKQYLYFGQKYKWPIRKKDFSESHTEYVTPKN